MIVNPFDGSCRGSSERRKDFKILAPEHLTSAPGGRKVFFFTAHKVACPLNSRRADPWHPQCGCAEKDERLTEELQGTS
jgi:hypothetical protein